MSLSGPALDSISNLERQPSRRANPNTSPCAYPLAPLAAREIETGELPEDWELIGDLVRDVSFENAAGSSGSSCLG
ncbi:MAG: hypothetical protein JO159_19105 [Acidobacteria bacterium]|nr:hypothetical protein [Acidobacteriota bacterium]